MLLNPYIVDRYPAVLQHSLPSWFPQRYLQFVTPPNFALCFSATFSIFTSKVYASPDGWYDLRVALTDAAGNSQMQTISPASTPPGPGIYIVRHAGKSVKVIL